ncbi:palmitoyl-protein thioesterase 1, partial [Asbolus verrucosus]
DSCCFSFSLGAVQKKLNETLPGVHILSLRIGDSEVTDVENGYFLHPDKQIQMACDIIKNDPLLADGFNAIGFSQGAQFLRALVQRCSAVKIKNLISLGGQHQVQKLLVQASYWHDPLHETEYKNFSTFLSDINNEITLNEDYIERLQTLDNFVLVKFENDTIVEPAETEWFGFYKPGQSEEIQTLKESTLYIDDRLGLRKLDEDSKLHFLAVPGNHLKFEWSWFEENIINVYLRN